MRTPCGPLNPPALAVTPLTPLEGVREALWLLAVGLVPLVFGPPQVMAAFDVPKVALLHACAGLLLVTWPWLPRARLFGRSGWVLRAMTAHVLAVLAAAVVSPVPRLAFRGAQPETDGYAFTVIGALAVTGVSIALGVRTRAQVLRLAGAIVAAGAAGAAYGILQQAGRDPLDLVVHFPGVRIISTFGNPIFFGASLLLALPFSVVGVLLAWRGRRPAGGPAPPLAAAGAVAVVSMLVVGLGVSLARGPWVGALVALTVTLGLVAATQGRAWVLRAIAAVGVAGVLAALLLAVLPSRPTAVSSLDDTPLSAVAVRAESVGGGLASGLTGRTQIWREAARLVARRPWFAFENGGPVPHSWLTRARAAGKAGLRHLFGYGPETFQYVHPLAQEPPPTQEITRTDDAHNALVHAWVEIGIVGLVATLALTLTPIVVGVLALSHSGRGWHTWARLTMIAAVAALAGRAVEQLAGVPQVSDRVTSWALVGLVAALPGVAQPTTSRLRAGPAEQGRARAPLAYGAACVIAVLVVWQVLAPSARQVLASVDSTSAAEAASRGDHLEAARLVDRAVRRGPSVSAYRVQTADNLDAVRKTAPDRADQEQLIRGALETLQAGLAYNRLDLPLNASVATHLRDLARLGGATTSTDAVAAFERVAALIPNHWQGHFHLARAYVEAGRPADALPHATFVLNTLTEGLAAAEAYYLKGAALLARGDRAAAEVALREAIARRPDFAFADDARALLARMGLTP